jgi:hypothetical protein
MVFIYNATFSDKLTLQMCLTDTAIVSFCFWDTPENHVRVKLYFVNKLDEEGIRIEIYCCHAQAQCVGTYSENFILFEQYKILLAGAQRSPRPTSILYTVHVLC